MPPAIQPSYQSFCRLIQNDDSSDFSFIIKYVQDQMKQQTEIKTTLNKARVISQKVNAYYQTDPTIQNIEINIPFHLKFVKEETQIKEKIDKVFQSIINSTNNPIPVSEEEIFLFTLLLRIIDYQEKDEHSSFEFTKFISTIEEAISLLATSFHSSAVQFLSKHFIDFLKSGMFKKIDETIIFDIIDFYVHIGTFYENGNGISRGGYGCGGSKSGDYAPGGGWCQGSNEGQATSWSLDMKAIGTDGFSKSNGSVIIKYKD